ncbi:MAG: hypothetical protein WC492_02470 [Candidatus Micrarchaeia archaeon]
MELLSGLDIGTVSAAITTIAALVAIMADWKPAERTFRSVVRFFHTKKDRIKDVMWGLAAVAFGVWIFINLGTPLVESHKFYFSTLYGAEYEQCGEYFCTRIPDGGNAIAKITGVEYPADKKIILRFEPPISGTLVWNGNDTQVLDGDSFQTEDVVENNIFMIKATGGKDIVVSHFFVDIEDVGMTNIYKSIFSAILVIAGVLKIAGRLDDTIDSIRGPEYVAENTIKDIILDMREEEQAAHNKKYMADVMSEIKDMLGRNEIKKDVYEEAKEVSEKIKKMSRSEFRDFLGEK